VISKLSSHVSSRLALWLAVGVCASVIVLGVFAYQGVREWERTATQLAERHAQESADMLAVALTRDMRGAQESVLSSRDWSDSIEDGSSDLRGLVASAFARFPYPELFFVWSGAGAEGSVQFLGRAERLPPWFDRLASSRPAPVALGTSPVVERLLLNRIARDITARHRYSTFDIEIDNQPYQVVARLQYRDPYREMSDLTFGFMVNLNWTREHYVPQVASQVARIAGAASNLAFAISPRQEPVNDMPRQTLSGRRVIPMVFFDPLLIAADPPADLVIQQWTLEALLSRDSTLQAARKGARRTMTVVVLGGVGLALGLLLTVSSTRSLARLAQLRSDFVATVTHELKSPIATIRAAGDTLASGRFTDPDASRRYAQLMVDESKHMTRLLDNLLAYARIADTTEAYSFAAVTVDAVVNQSLRGAKSRLDSAGFDVDVQIPPDLPPMHADWTSICLAVDNLVDNAIRYAKDRRSIKIVAKRVENTVKLQVIDSGVGIPADELHHVTARFFRGRASASGGSGLGLAIVERIVNDHGGSLSISSSVGVGTTVEITLPVATERDVSSGVRA